MGFVRIWQLISNSCSKDRESMVYVWNVLFSHHIWSDNYQTRWESIHYCLSNQLHSISFRNINDHLSQVSNLILCRMGIIIGCSMLDCIGLCVKWDCLFLWNKHIFHHFITFSRSLDFQWPYSKVLKHKVGNYGRQPAFFPDLRSLNRFYNKPTLDFHWPPSQTYISRARVW